MIDNCFVSHSCLAKKENKPLPYFTSRVPGICTLGPVINGINVHSLPAIGRAFNMRNVGDYDVRPNFTAGAVEELLSWAHEFIGAVEDFLQAAD
jgi:hypothetical protein